MERTGLEPVTPCLQSIYEEGECLQLAHSRDSDAHIFPHRRPNVCNLHTNVCVIVCVLGATHYMPQPPTEVYPSTSATDAVPFTDPQGILGFGNLGITAVRLRHGMAVANPMKAKVTLENV